MRYMDVCRRLAIHACMSHVGMYVARWHVCRTLACMSRRNAIHPSISCPISHTATLYNTLQHPATHCNALQHTATHRNTLQHNVTSCDTATRCNTLQHAATRCDTVHLMSHLRRETTVRHCTRENTLQHICNTLQHTECNNLQQTATNCNKLQHTATRCNTQDQALHKNTQDDVLTCLSDTTYTCATP